MRMDWGDPPRVPSDLLKEPEPERTAD
jgi:hypothetical protein